MTPDRHLKKACPVCGRPMHRLARQCRSCFEASFANDIGPRRCTACGELKALSEFRVRTRKTPRPRSTCKGCEAAKQQAKRNDPAFRARATRLKQRWQRNNPEKHALARLRKAIRKLGLQDDMQLILDFFGRGAGCAICGRQPPEAGHRYTRLSIDHDHITRRFRGLLCHDCNLGIGRFRENPELLRTAARYIEAGIGPICASKWNL